jgi:hypothetical protein
LVCAVTDTRVPASDVWPFMAMMLAMTTVAFAGPQAHADAVRQPTMSKHEMSVKTAGCMRKRMSTDRAVSYNEALRTCKAQLGKPSDNSSGADPPAFAGATDP